MRSDPARPLYQLHALGAAGAAAANPDPHGDRPCGAGLDVLGRWLDHVAGLGSGGVLLTPVHVSATHGYDTVDPFRIDQRLGDDDAFARFAGACHERGLSLVLDGVFNHVGREFGPFRDVLAHGQGSAFADWFRLDFSRDDGDGFGYRTFEGHRELAALNHRNPEVLEWAAAVAVHWLDRGADGWRLDAAYAMPAEFLAAFAGKVRERHPDAFLFGEVIHGDYPAFVAASGLDSVTQYELHKATWSALNDANLFELAWALDRHREFAAAFPPVTFMGNHDVTRLATQLGSTAHLAHAVTVLLTLPGHPCVYYGDELAWRGRKEHRPGGDDAVRPALPADASPAGDEQAWALALHRELVAVRHDRPWLASAEVRVVELANRTMTYTVTGAGGELLVGLAVDGPTLEPPPGWRPVAGYPGVVIAER